MKLSKQELSLPEMIDALRKEVAGYEGKPATFEIEQRRLLLWLIEKDLEAKELPYTPGGLDGGGERGEFERATDEEYRKRLRELRQKYGKPDPFMAGNKD